MLILLPIIAWVLLFFLIYQNHCWRTSVLLAAIIWGTIVTAIVELLSLFNLINLWGIILTWSCVDLIFAGLYWKFIYPNRKPISIRFQLPFYSIALLIGVALIVITLGIIALVAPPNTWDSMTYHMPRVVHWMQNQNVTHYPTNYLPQLYQSPWSEFTIMNFQILSGGDRFANLVQWFSMIGSLIGVSLIAKKLGAQSFGQILSVVFTATLPMGIMQATSTKNDYAVAFWLVCFVYFILEALDSKITAKNCAKISVSLGLALLTKITAYFYAFPFCIWFGIEILIYHRSKLWRSAIALSIPALFINIGYYLRNIDLFGIPLFTENSDYKIEYFSIPTFISNVVRNMALHMPIPFEFVNNKYIEQLIYEFHEAILKIDINDPRITDPNVEFTIIYPSNFEDLAANPFHFYLILLAIILFLCISRIRRKQEIAKYLIVVIAAFLFFCLLLQWKPWQSRLHIAIFVLFSAFVGTVFEKSLGKQLSLYFAIALIFLSSFWVLLNASRPAITKKNIFNTTRIEQYFHFNYSVPFEEDYIDTAQFVKSLNCSQIGLSLYGDDWEYPLWVLLKQDSIVPTQIQHIDIENISKVQQDKFEYNRFSPCAIIDFGKNSAPTLSNEFGVYDRRFSGKSLLKDKPTKLLRVYVKRESR